MPTIATPIRAWAQHGYAYMAVRVQLPTGPVELVGRTKIQDETGQVKPLAQIRQELIVAIKADWAAQKDDTAEQALGPAFDLDT